MTVVDFPKFLSLDTTLGRLRFVGSVLGDGITAAQSSLAERKPVGSLPGGMAVEVWRAVVFSVSSKSLLREVTFRCHLETDLKCDLCAGEGLDAQEWESDDRLVVIGTEDGEWLAKRHPFLRCEDGCIVSYGAQSITITLEDVPRVRVWSCTSS